MKKAKKMRPLTEETEEDHDDIMNSNKYTTSSKNMTTQSKFAKSTGMKVKGGNASSLETTKQTKFKKPVYNNEFTLDKQSKKNINNSDYITEEEQVYSEKPEKTIIKTEKSHKTNKTSNTNKSKSKSKRNSNNNHNDDVSNTEKKRSKKDKSKVATENSNAVQESFEESKRKRKSKSKKKKSEVMDFDKLKEFKASTVDAVDPIDHTESPDMNMNYETASQIAKEKKVKKRALKDADVDINANHEVVMLGEVKKPNNLNADSVIVSSKM